MAFGRPANRLTKITFVQGRRKNIVVRLKNKATGEPLNTAGWTVLGQLRWQDGDLVTLVDLTGSSVLSIDAAGNVTGQVQPAVFADMPPGRRTDVIVTLTAFSGAEEDVLAAPINLEVIEA